MKRGIWLSLGVLALLGSVVSAGFGWWQGRNAMDPQLAARWSDFDETVRLSVDHEPWQWLLDDYLESETDDGVARVDYEGLQEEAFEDLQDYIAQLSSTDPRGTARNDQMAYWINLYNAVTVALIVDHYPVSSITDLGETQLAFGPWDDKLVSVAGESLSLNDIEHGILRPVFGDPRIHFGVNCASIGCPNLMAEAFTGDNLDELLELAAATFMEHPRAVSWDGDQLLMSSLFDWYGSDFGKSTEAQLATLASYCPEPVGARLKAHRGSTDYHYDWQLNDLRF